jgi:hypothetical protein
VKIVGDHFKLDNFAYPEYGSDKKETIVAGECKPWPTDKSRMIAAFANDAGVAYEEPGSTERKIQIFLALVDTEKKQVIASYETTVEEDALIYFSEYSLRLDTARYILSKTDRAFALRMGVNRCGCAYDGCWDDELTLFVISGKKLRPILSQTMQHQWQSGATCGGEGEITVIGASTFIAIENTTTNGFANLRLSVASNAKKKPPNRVIKYNGKEYDLVQWNKAFNDWWEVVYEQEMVRPQVKP